MKYVRLMILVFLSFYISLLPTNTSEQHTSLLVQYFGKLINIKNNELVFVSTETTRGFFSNIHTILNSDPFVSMDLFEYDVQEVMCNYQFKYPLTINIKVSRGVVVYEFLSCDNVEINVY